MRHGLVDPVPRRRRRQDYRRWQRVRVERRISCRGAIVVAGQRIHVGMVHAGRTVTIESADHTFRVYDGDELLTEAARTTTKPIARFKVRKPEPPRPTTTRQRLP